jgi:hypothetical protein
VVAATTLGGGDDNPPDGAAAETTASVTQETAPETTPATQVPDGPFVNLQSVDLDDDDHYVITDTVTGYTPDVEDPEALHIHFFLNTTEPEDAGTNGDLRVCGSSPTLDVYTTAYGPEGKGDATQMCSAVATFDHEVFHRGTTTGNCVDLPA